MQAVVGWVVIGGVVYMAYRAVRKWRREWKQGLTSVSTAVEAAASAIAHADAGGVHLHLTLGGVGQQVNALGAPGQLIDLPAAEQSPDVAEIVRRLTESLAEHSLQTQLPILESVPVERGR